MPGDDLGEALKGFLRIGIFIGGGGLLLIFAVPAGSAEQVVSVCSAAIGLVIILGVVLVKRALEK